MLSPIQLNNISFTSRLPKGEFCDVRDIPNIRCAMCGKVMLSQIEYDTFSSSDEIDRENVVKMLPAKIRYTNPQGCAWLSRNLKKTDVENIEKYYENYIKNHDDTIKKNTDKQVKAVLQEFIKLQETINERHKLTNEQIIKKLEKISDILPDKNRDFIPLLKKYTESFPDATITQIMNSKVLFDYHFLFSNERKINYRKEARELFSEMMGCNLELWDKIQLDNTYENISRISMTKQTSLQMKKKLIDDEFESYLATVNNKKTKQQLRKLFSKYEIYMENADNMFCDIYNCKFDNDADIIKYIIWPIQSTFEHVKAKSMGGEKEYGNGIYMHAICNTQRGTYSYEKMSEIFPDFPQNIQKQVNRVSSFINGGRLYGYDDWPQQIQKTLSETANLDIKI